MFTLHLYHLFQTQCCLCGQKKRPVKYTTSCAPESVFFHLSNFNSETWCKCFRNSLSQYFHHTKYREQRNRNVKNVNNWRETTTFSRQVTWKWCSPACVWYVTEKNTRLGLLKVTAVARCDLHCRRRVSPVLAVTVNPGMSPRWQPHYSDNSAGWKYFCDVMMCSCSSHDCRI